MCNHCCNHNLASGHLLCTAFPELDNIKFYVKLRNADWLF
uniref:Uncharacterized protein n=1 Tax=Anguilla anguilla TaxID=7936 RepID=A0A0E9UFP2_ANGAN